MCDCVDRVSNLAKEVKELQVEVIGLRSDIQKLTHIMESNATACQRMDSHIDFVEGVYETVKGPMEYVVGSVNGLMGGAVAALPSPKTDN